MNRKGKLIVLEGIDGSGKSTQIQMLKDVLIAKGYSVVCTQEPTQDKIGQMIRSILKEHQNVHQAAIALLFAADRLLHISDEKQGMLSLLNQVDYILCDRYYFSSLAYHSVYVPMDWVYEINSMNIALLKADMHIFIDTKPNVALQRIIHNRTAQEMYENKSMLEKVYDNYMLAFTKYRNNENIQLVNGNDTTEKLHKIILEKVL